MGRRNPKGECCAWGQSRFVLCPADASVTLRGVTTTGKASVRTSEQLQREPFSIITARSPKLCGKHLIKSPSGVEDWSGTPCIPCCFLLWEVLSPTHNLVAETGSGLRKRERSFLGVDIDTPHHGYFPSTGGISWLRSCRHQVTFPACTFWLWANDLGVWVTTPVNAWEGGEGIVQESPH